MALFCLSSKVSRLGGSNWRGRAPSVNTCRVVAGNKDNQCSALGTRFLVKWDPFCLFQEGASETWSRMEFPLQSKSSIMVRKVCYKYAACCGPPKIVNYLITRISVHKKYFIHNSLGFWFNSAVNYATQFQTQLKPALNNISLYQNEPSIQSMNFT